MSTLTQQDFQFPRASQDIKVSINGQEVIGYVNPEAMALASPAWEKFMYPMSDRSWTQLQHNASVSPAPFYNSCTKPLMKKTPVDFTCDDAEALCILFSIAHHQLGKVPLTTSPQLLYKLAVLCDQYLCVQIIKAWIKPWLESAVKDKHESKSSIQVEQWLTIYWAFGEEEKLNVLLMSMLRNATSNETAQLTWSEDRYSKELFPLASSSVQTHRHRVMSMFLSVLHTAIESNQANDNVDLASMTQCLDSSCREWTSRNLLNIARAHDLWPRKKPEEVTYSLEYLFRCFSGEFYAWDHKICQKRIGLEVELEKVWKEMRCPVEESILTYLGRTREKLHSSKFGVSDKGTQL